MAELVPDPLAGGSIARMGREFRARISSVAAVTAAYLARIAALDARLGVVVDAMDPSTAAVLPDAMAADEDLVEIAGPAAGMVLRAQNERVGV